MSKREKADIDACVMHFRDNEPLFQNAADGVVLSCMNDPELRTFIHVIKHRLKDPKHLRLKLRKRALEDKKSGKRPTISQQNLFREITDLAGVRILHLHTDQMVVMNKRILAVLAEQKYQVAQPVANVWDKEAEAYFEKLGFRTAFRESMYTSVHYDIELNTVAGVRCELQVRTLADEVWGEVSHAIDYPRPSRSIACKEQLKVLARVTSGCTRLVDSIFRSREEFERHGRTRPRQRTVSGAKNPGS